MGTPWWLGPALAFDLESTGVNVAQDRIVTVALLHLDGPSVRPERYLLDPGIEIPESATAIHGISTQHAREHGERPGPALSDAAAKLAQAMRSGTPVTGMNLSFDLSLLHFECIRHGIPTLSDRLGGAVRPVVDVLILDRHVDKYRPGSRTLAALCTQYEVKHHGAHDSAYDALAAAQIAAVIAERFPRVGSLLLDELHDAQVAWAHEQRTDLQAHFDRKRREGEARKVVELGWPLYDQCADVAVSP
jgi:DNA polymerase-3 subunit epsilon